MISFSLGLEMLPAGFAADNAQPGMSCPIIQKAFLTTDDGEDLYTYLDGIAGQYLAAELAKRHIPLELINNALINITGGNKAQVYLNFSMVITAIAKKPIETGSAVMHSDIADIRAVSFSEFPMPTEGAIVYSFREGWRWALYFDYTMLPDEPGRALTNLPQLFAQFGNIMRFRDLFRMRPELLQKMYEAGWFPFIRLPLPLLKNLHSALQAGFSIENETRELLKSVSDEEFVRLLEQWKTKPVFTQHADLLERAVQRYLSGDYVSSSHILAPRIEGILRTLHLGQGRKPKSPELIDGLVDKVRGLVEGPSAFLPEAFRDYLRTYLYAGFDLEQGRVDFSRHSIAHGVTPANQFDQVRAFQLLLIVDQIAFYTEPAP